MSELRDVLLADVRPHEGRMYSGRIEAIVDAAVAAIRAELAQGTLTDNGVPIVKRPVAPQGCIHCGRPVSSAGTDSRRVGDRWAHGACIRFEEAFEAGDPLALRIRAEHRAGRG